MCGFLWIEGNEIDEGEQEKIKQGVGFLLESREELTRILAKIALININNK
jgi:hypothetical protein